MVQAVCIFAAASRWPLPLEYLKCNRLQITKWHHKGDARDRAKLGSMGIIHHARLINMIIIIIRRKHINMISNASHANLQGSEKRQEFTTTQTSRTRNWELATDISGHSFADVQRQQHPNTQTVLLPAQHRCHSSISCMPRYICHKGGAACKCACPPYQAIIESKKPIHLTNQTL